MLWYLEYPETWLSGSSWQHWQNGLCSFFSKWYMDEKLSSGFLSTPGIPACQGVWRRGSPPEISCLGARKKTEQMETVGPTLETGSGEYWAYGNKEVDFVVL